MEKILIQQNSHWKGEEYPSIMDRAIFQTIKKNLVLKEIQVISGVRRSGKSTLFKIIINHLMKKNAPGSILYINFDDPVFIDICKNAAKINGILEIAEKITEEKFKYIFLDEIQHVKYWEKFVKSVYDSEVYKKIFITGSNSSLLKGEYADLLSGRYVLNKVFPFSFKEALQNAGIKTKIELIERKSEVLKQIDMLLEFGGYPEVFKASDPELKRTLLINYFDTIVLKDCIARGKIRDVKTFRELTHFVISNCTAPFNYLSLAKTIASNENTVKDFLGYLEDSFLISELKQFYLSVKKQIKGKRKIYCVDNGFPANISFRFVENKGPLFENLVYTELLKRYDEIYFNNIDNECDFIVKKGNVYNAFQACYELTDINMKRETEGLKSVIGKYPVTDASIITYNQEQKGDTIHVIPFWKIFFK